MRANARTDVWQYSATSSMFPATTTRSSNLVDGWYQPQPQPASEYISNLSQALTKLMPRKIEKNAGDYFLRIFVFNNILFNVL